MNTGSSAELRITFSKPRLITREDNTERVAADVRMVYELDGVSVAGSETFAFVAPIGLLEAEDIKWYLESYYIWPVGLFKDRAERIEHNLPQWGLQLLDALTTHSSTQTVFQQWLRAAETYEPVFSLQVLPEGTPESNTAASRLLGLPWELLHYQQQYLVDHQPPIRVRRNLPNASELPTHSSEQTTIRILAVSPRPLDAGYIDHRISIKPLIEAIEGLVNKAELVRVHPSTIDQLEHELQQAESAGKPFHVVHFDGHGIFDVKTGRGALCFEHKLDNDKLLPEFVKRVYADELAALLSQHQIPLVFLEACQTGQSDDDPNASVAAALLQAGVLSVVAMSHSVLVETARRFVSSFYQQLAAGQRIGTAVLAGRQSLMENNDRINIAGVGMLQMQDWFVPLLYQREDDPRFFETALQVSEVEKPALRLGDLPDTPIHTFIGRSLELLKLERLLELRPYAVIRGMGGQGKTALAVELAHWLVQSRRFDRCAFVSVEQYTHENAVVEVLLHQLVNADHNLAAEYENDVDQALSAIRETLEQERTLIVVDNMESLLADAENKQAVLDVLAKLPEAKLLFTTREPLPEPFCYKACDIELGALSLSDAKALVMRVMNNEGLVLRHDDMGNTPEEVDDLVDAVGCHARALVLLARELAQRGVTATTENVRAIMVELEQRHPGERELSLFASVELSLRQLSPEVREQIGGLAVFHNGGGLNIMMLVLGVSENRIRECRSEIESVGLGKMVGDYGYLSLDPSLPTYLRLEQSKEEYAGYRKAWYETMEQLVDFLYGNLQDMELATQLTELELPNLMAYLQALVTNFLAEKVWSDVAIENIVKVEGLLHQLHQPQAMERVVAWREQVASGIVKWSNALFVYKGLSCEQLSRSGDFKGAFYAAKALLEQSQQAGEKAYFGADYDLSMAFLGLGEAAREYGKATQALPYLKEAQSRFEAQGSDRMAVSAILEQGDCLRDLGQLDAAVEAFKESLKRSKELEADRQTVVSKLSLSSVYLLQKRYDDALQSYRESLQLSNRLGNLKDAAVAWHQIGVIYKRLDNFEQAEQSLRQSLSLKNQLGDKMSEAKTLGEVGNLYFAWNRPEQAISFLRQAVDIYVTSGESPYEGMYRYNIAINLIKLLRYDEARSELLCAIECDKHYDDLVKPWKTWDALYQLEKICCNSQAAKKARNEALTTYLAFRNNGGDGQSGASGLAMIVEQVLGEARQEDLEEAERELRELLDYPAWQGKESKSYLHKLLEILAGERDFSLAQDEGLNYEASTELILLLERLQE